MAWIQGIVVNILVFTNLNKSLELNVVQNHYFCSLLKGQLYLYTNVNYSILYENDICESNKYLEYSLFHFCLTIR